MNIKQIRSQEGIEGLLSTYMRVKEPNFEFVIAGSICLDFDHRATLVHIIQMLKGENPVRGDLRWDSLAEELQYYDGTRWVLVGGSLN